MQNGWLIAKTRLFLSRIFLLEKFHSSVLNDEYLRCWIEQGGKITGIHQPGSIRVDSTLRLLPTEEFRSIRYHEEVQLGEDGLSSRIQETRLLLAEQKGNDEGGFHGNASFRSWSWFRRLSSTLRSTQQRIPTRRRESNDFAIIIARIHLACDSYQEYFSFHLLHWWQINVPDRNGRLVPSKIPNFWNYYVKHGFI